MKISEMRDLTADELQAKERDLKKELFDLRVQLMGGRVEKPSRIREVRRDIARIQTLMNQKRTSSSERSR
jgi:large subunit ribosomal protein L29